MVYPSVFTHLSASRHTGEEDFPDAGMSGATGMPDDNGELQRG
jgi:hypothetical protein